MNLLKEKTTESPYGDPVDPTQAPEMISKAVSSLPPEQVTFSNYILVV